MSAPRPVRIEVHIRRIVCEAKVSHGEDDHPSMEGAKDQLAEKIRAAIQDSMAQSSRQSVTLGTEGGASLAAAIARSVATQPMLVPYFQRPTESVAPALGSVEVTR
jgi:hypothetical protein